MPAIKLQGSPSDSWWVQALMLFPHDPTAREVAFYSFMADDESFGAANEEQRTLSVGCIRSLLNGPSKADRKQAYKSSARRAMVAGDLLAAMYLMRKFDLEEPSMGKAIFVLGEFARDRQWKDGVQMNASDRMIRKDWKAFRSVSHLWAARRLLELYPPKVKSPIFSAESLPTFLGVAAAAFEFGSTFIPKRQKSADAILEAGDCWTLPSSIGPLHLSGGRKPDKLVAALSRYKAS